MKKIAFVCGQNRVKRVENLRKKNKKSKGINETRTQNENFGELKEPKRKLLNSCCFDHCDNRCERKNPNGYALNRWTIRLESKPLPEVMGFECGNE